MNQQFHIREYIPSDADAVAEIFHRSVMTIGPRDYSPQQVAAWASRSPTAAAMHARFCDGRTALVAIGEAGHPVAFGDLEKNGHLDFLYCAPEVAGRGVAAALYDRLEAVARAAQLARIHTEASEAARRLFERKGFRVVARRDLVMDGTPIHNYAMEKVL